MAELQFIQVDGRDNSTKSMKRQAIRIHVMKNFHRQRKREAAERMFSRAIEKIDNSPERTVEARQALILVNGPCFQSEVGDLPCTKDYFESFDDKQGVTGPDMRDPMFFTPSAEQVLLPVYPTHVLIDQQDVAHIESSSALLSANPTSSPLTTTWLPASRAHAYLYHASVFVCSASIETLAQKNLSPISFYHRGLAIGMINDRLSDPMQCKTDETIAAIISLANFECIVGNTSSLTYHVRGLMELTGMRGGLDQLGMNGMLKKLIQIYVWFLDIYSHAGPRAIPQSLTSTGPPLSDLTAFYQLITLETSVSHFLLAETPLLSILKDTFDLENEAVTSPPFPHSTDLFSSLNASPLLPIPAHPNYTHLSCHLSVLLYHTQPSAASRTAHAHTLKDYLSLSDTSALWLPFPGALLWCLVVGTQCSTGDDALYSWFAAQLMRFWVPLSLHRWEGLERALGWFGRLLKRRRDLAYCQHTRRI